MSNNLIDSFSKSRAEEYPSDVWNKFVIPPKYEEYARLFNYHRAVMIEGGRGSGKTMFLKYHCHNTRFSPRRKHITSEELNHVGLYFRPDTDFCAMINEFNYGDEWRKVFTHYIFINLLEDFVSSIESIAKTTFEDISLANSLLDLSVPESLVKNISGLPKTYGELKKYQKNLHASFNLWLNDIESFDKPPLIEPRTILMQLIDGLQQSSSELQDISFYVYFDEFENLSSLQQSILNSWMKHGQKPLLFNAAYKKGVKVNRSTVGAEKLVLRNDYKVVDLENFTMPEFKVFAAEVLTLKLMEVVKLDEYEIAKKLFCDEEFIIQRQSSEHKAAVLKTAKSFLPDKSYKEMARDIIDDDTLRKRIERFLVAPSLPKDTNFSPSDFIDSAYPEESLINGLLLNRKSHDAISVLEKFTRFKSKADSSEYKSLIEQYLVGAILWTYLSASWKKCPVYAGFDRFCLLARGNMRHFIELCYQTLTVANNHSIHISKERITPIPVEIQAEASIGSSRLEIEKVDELGRHGEKLRFIVNRLGLFFQLLQRRKSQSENEVNHFSIKLADDSLVDETTRTLLDEAKIWSVLVEVEGDTKRKNISDMSSKEYMLHPIFSPNFGISFRRKKKFEFTEMQIQTIFSGKESDYVDLCNDYSKKWDITSSQTIDNTKVNTAEAIQRGLWDDITG